MVELSIVLLGGWWCGALLAGLLPSASLERMPGPERLRTALPSVNELAHLFGTRSERPPAPKPSLAQVQALNMRLLGTVVAGKDSMALLVLAPAAGQQLFRVGETIRPGIVLVEVHRDSIVIERNGTRETIAMEKSKELALPHAAFAERGAKVAVRRQFLDSQLQHLPELLSQVRAVPHYADGRFDGFVLMDIKPSSVFERFGFKNGDVLLSVNGKMAHTPQEAMQLYQTLRKASAYDVEIRRGGRRMQLHVDVR